MIDVVPPPHSGQPGPAPRYGPCGHRFQAGVAVGTATCACGRYSIGRCTDCDEPLCGLHGRGEDSLRCADCERAAVARQRASEEESRAGEAVRLERVRTRLGEASDPDEIVELLSAAGTGADWFEPCRAAWARLASSGFLRPADAEVVRMRFRRRPLGGQETSEQWRRPAWSCRTNGTWSPGAEAAEGQRGCWLDDEGTVWMQERLISTAGKTSPGVPTSVTESKWGDRPAADEEGGGLWAKSFLVEPGQPAAMEVSIVRHTYGFHDKTKRERLWNLAGKSLPLGDCSNHMDQRERFALIAASAI